LGRGAGADKSALVGQLGHKEFKGHEDSLAHKVHKEFKAQEGREVSVV
jgi:hypothetical protein